MNKVIYSDMLNLYCNDETFSKLPKNLLDPKLLEKTLE